MRTSIGRKKYYITLFTLVMVNVVVVANLRFLPHMARVGLFSIFFYLLAALFFFFPIALITAELSSIWPDEGGVYNWATKAFNKVTGFVTAFLQWLLSLLLYIVILSFAAVSFAFVIMPDNHAALILATNKLYVVVFILITYWTITFLNLKRNEISGRISITGAIAGVFVPVCILLALIVIYFTFGPVSHIKVSLNDFIPDMGKLSNLKLAIGTFIYFLGIEMAVNHGGAISNPHKNYPYGIIISAIIILAVFVLSTLAIVFMVKIRTDTLGTELSEIISKMFFYPELKFLIKIFALSLSIGALCAVSSWISGVGKGFLKAVSDTKMSSWADKVNIHGAPKRLLILQGVLVSSLCLLFALQPSVSLVSVMLADSIVVIYLVIYIIMFISAIRLRYRYPDVKRPFKVPFGNFGIWFLGLLGCTSAGFGVFNGVYLPLRLSGKKHLFVSATFIISVLSVICFSFLITYSKKFKLLIFEKSDHAKNKKEHVALLLVFTGIFSYFAKYALNLVLTRNLSPDDYGDFSIFMRLILIISFILLIGTNNVTQKYLSKYFSTEKIRYIKNFIRWNIKIISKTFILYLLILFSFYVVFFILHIVKIHDITTCQYAFYYLLIAPFSALTILLASYILSNKWPVLSYFFSKSAVFVVMLFLVTFAIIFFKVSINLENMAIFVFMSCLIIIVLELVYINRIFDEHRISLILRKYKKAIVSSQTKYLWISDSFRMAGDQLLFNIIWAADLFILEIIHPDEHDVGYYAAMLILTSILAVSPGAISNLIIPRISSLVSEKKFNELQHNINIINFINISILLVSTIVLILFSNELLGFFGPGYSNAQFPFIILCVSYFMSSSFIPLGRILNYAETKITFKLNLCELSMAIVFGCIFTYYWGLLGIALSVFVTITIKVLLTFIMLKKKIPIKPLTII